LAGPAAATEDYWPGLQATAVSAEV